MMVCIGQNSINDKVYALNDKYGIDENGMIIKIGDSESFEFTNYYSSTHIDEYTDIEDIRNSIIDLTHVHVDGHILDVYAKMIDGERFTEVIHHTLEGPHELFTLTKHLPLKYQIFGRREDAASLIHYNKSAAIITNENKVVFHKDNLEKDNKRLHAILKTIACQFQSHENFKRLESERKISF